jgi:rare lipoprotein A
MEIRSLVRSAVTFVLPIALGACTMVGYPAGSAGPTPSDDAPAAMPRSGGVGTPAGAGGPWTPAAGGTTGLKTQAGRTYEVFGVEYRVLNSADGYEATGLASWYGEQFHGRPTATGETYDMHRHSAAHRTLPLHTWVEVTNLDNGRSLVLRVNDRGPFADTDRRILDLSYAAAEELGVVGPGTAPVRVRAVGRVGTRGRDGR